MVLLLYHYLLSAQMCNRSTLSHVTHHGLTTLALCPCSKLDYPFCFVGPGRLVGTEGTPHRVSDELTRAVTHKERPYTRAT